MPTPTQSVQPFTSQHAQHLAATHFNLTATATPLPGELDQNFKLTTADDQSYVLKLSRPHAPRDVLDLQHAALLHVAAHGAPVQRPLATPSGETVAVLETPDGPDVSVGPRLAQLLTYLPGTLWAHCNPHTPALLRNLGAALGQVDAALANFSHPAAQRELKWDLAKANWIRDYIAHIAQPDRRALVENWLGDYEARVQPALAGLRQQVIYNDANDYNIVVGVNAAKLDSTSEVESNLALIDFGDVVHSALICDLAIACAYAMLSQADPLSAARDVVTGFHAAFPLAEAEVEVLWPLIAMRLCVSVVNSAWQQHIEPDNDYLQISAQPAWQLLMQFEGIHPNLAHYTFRAACGWPAVPHGPAVVQWLQDHAGEIGNIVEPDLKTCPKIYSDWSVGSLELGNPTEYDDAAKFTRKIWARMAENNVAVAIGGYEWRTVHLGLDLFMDAGTPIFAPLDGTVHSFAFNDAKFDYGPCIVLEHVVKVDQVDQVGKVERQPELNQPYKPDQPDQPDQPYELRFFTLYGHLTLDSLDGLTVGKPVKRGEQIGKIGPYPTNGDWPPHLHLQIILDMLDQHGDFYGSCRPSQREVWLSLCPDANLITQIPAAFFPAPAPALEDIKAARQAHIGPNLSTSYRNKLHIVRGYKQWLYDADGQRYLDVVNNVAHVGHCHPAVVRAGQLQMAVLNTNTRYLHENLTRYAERLTATLPASLSVCYFVNSGSEANELALRLARAHTHQKDMLVIDVGYHGNTTSLVDISPYKHTHAGGMGPPNWVHATAMPDVYRGPYKVDDPDAGPKYAAHLAKLIAQIPGLPPHVQLPNADVKWAARRNIAGFIAESVLSCGGQIVLPPGYLRTAYNSVRAAGGVCIADEVQTGFGRVGSHFWAFETQGADVIPDIVTMGKPAGNGHPLGIVVTTPEIAASFNNGLEYFNTFGGNPVSCAIGLAVLEVIEHERLQAHALQVGAHLLDGLRTLQGSHEIIGDVRGLGLFSGFELVRDRITLEPATHQASNLVNRMKDHGILLSTDGPHENVIKLKPPLCFDVGNADFLLSTLDKVLREDGVRINE